MWPENGSEKRRLPGKHSVDAANRVESELFETFEALARTPGQGHKRTDLTAEAVLFFPVYSYLVVYRPENLFVPAPRDTGAATEFIQRTGCLPRRISARFRNFADFPHLPATLLK